MFEKEYSLPGSEGEIAFVDGDNFAGPSQRHSQVARAIIGTLVGVDKVGKVFRDEVIEKGVQVGSGLRVCVFHDDQTGTGVADENGELTTLNPRFYEEFANFPGEFVGPFSTGSDGEFAGVSFKVHQKV